MMNLFSMAQNAASQAAKPDMADTIVKAVVETGIFVTIGLVVFLIAFFLMTKITPFSIRKEIEEDQNTALGIMIGAVMIGLAIIIAAAIGGN
jgi:putative membrane protein